MCSNEDRVDTQENETKSNPLYDDEILHQGFEAIKTLNTTYIMSKEMLSFAKELIKVIYVNIALIENKELKVNTVMKFLTLKGKINYLILFEIMSICITQNQERIFKNLKSNSPKMPIGIK